MSIEPTTVPEALPVTKMVENTNIWHEMPGTHDEIVQNLVALGWEVVEEAEIATTMIHKLIAGTVRHIYKN